MERPWTSSQSPLLAHSSDYAGDGSVDLHGHPVRRSLTGRWRAAFLIIGVEIAERLAYVGIASNMITYLTDVLHETTATAAKNVNNWAGVTCVLPIFGAFIADSYLGRYWTILVASLVYLGGFVLLTLSTTLPFLKPSACNNNSASNYCSKATPLQIGVFFFSLYLVALGQGGHKPCLQAFGADQFDDEEPEERKYKSSFFNWWYFGICSGNVVALCVLTYIQDNVGWGLGFGIPAAAMAIALFVLLCGTRFYRHKLPGGSPLTQIVQVLVAAVRKRHLPMPSPEDKIINIIQEKEFTNVGFRRQLLPTNQFRFLDRATVEDDLNFENTKTYSWRPCTVTQVEEVKLVLRLIPIWVACLMYGVTLAQSETLFTKQGSTMDRKLSAHFLIPPAALQILISLSIIMLVPMYDCIFVPLAKRLTGNERGITLLQRIGIGMAISTLSMIVAALTEVKRLKAANDNQLVDMPHATIPMSIFWLLPQYILFGIADVFTMVGLQEYFYDQMPDTMRSLGAAAYLSVFGTADFLSSILISVIEKLCRRRKERSWFADNLNKAHLDYFYWLLATLSALNLFVYISFARCFIYKKVESNVSCDDDAA